MSSAQTHLKHLRLIAALGLPAHQSIGLMVAEIERMIACSFANFFWLGPDGRPVDAWMREVIPAAMDAFVGNHAALERDPREPTLDKFVAAGLRVGAGEAFYGAAGFTDTVVYNEVFRPYRIAGSIDLVVRDGSGTARGVLMVNRAAGSGGWSQSERALIAALHDHVLAAITGPCAQSIGECSAVADQSGCFLVDAAGRVEYHAGSAIALAAQHAGIPIAPGRMLGALGERLTPALHALLDRAIAIARGLPSPPPFDARGTPHGEIAVRVMPCLRSSAALEADDGGDSRYMICLERRPPLGAVVLGRAAALPLSARERELAVLLAQGHSPAEAAARMAISLATLRTYLKSVYARTGAGGREALVGMLRGA